MPYASNAGCSRHLTAGFSRVKLSESQFVVQKPYDVPLHERYEQSGGVRRMWVFATDKPGSGNHPGGARTEIKVDVLPPSKNNCIFRIGHTNQCQWKITEIPL